MERSITSYIPYIKAIFRSIYFNFHYLPIKQAIRFPILIYKAEIIKVKGKVIIDTKKITTGMIRLGFRCTNIYPNNGITWENLGSTVIFKGKALIGNDCYLSFGHGSTVVFGDDFMATSGLKMASKVGVTFGKSTRLGWGTLVMDTNFHPIYDMKKKKFKQYCGKITIGDYNWFGTNCKIMHSVETPERCIFGMNTVITRGCEAKSYCVMGGSPVRVLSEDVMRIIGQDKPMY